MNIYLIRKIILQPVQVNPFSEFMDFTTFAPPPFLFPPPLVIERLEYIMKLLVSMGHS